MFRVNPTATMDNVAAAKYLLAKRKDIALFSGINQNYAWGQDSYRDFKLAMADLAPKAAARQGAVAETVRRRIRRRDFDAADVEIAGRSLELLRRRPRSVHLSGRRARTLQRIPLLLTTGETSVYRLGAKLPDGAIIGARGPHTFFAHESDLNNWFLKTYLDRYSQQPIYPSYDMAQSLLGLKSAWEKAQAAKGGARPNTEEVIAAFEHLEIKTPSTTVKMANGNGHQGVSDTAYGTSKFDKKAEKPTLVDIVRYPAECVTPPADTELGDLAERRHEGRQSATDARLLPGLRGRLTGFADAADRTRHRD